MSMEHFAAGGEKESPWYIDMFKHPQNRWKEWGLTLGAAIIIAAL